MADVKNDEGTRRQERIQKEQHRPEQNEGYDEAARGGAGAPATDVGIPLNPGDSDMRRDDEFDRAAREAANDVRRQDRSAD
jgi:hypothetical protein